MLYVARWGSNIAIVTLDTISSNAVYGPTIYSHNCTIISGNKERLKPGFSMSFSKDELELLIDPNDILKELLT